MKYKEYTGKRKSLEDSARRLVDEGKFDEAEAEMDKIDSLDKQYDDEAETEERLTNMCALSDRRNYLPPWITGENNENKISGECVGSVMLGGYGSYGVRPAADKLFLGSEKSMTDFALEKHPEGRELLSMENALGDTVRGMVTGDWKNPALKNAVTTTSTGTLIPQVLSSQVIDLARDISLFSSAGVPTAPMETDNMTVSRMKTDPVFAFKAEGAAAEESSFEMDSVKLQAKTCYGYCYVTLEAIKSSQNLDAVIRQAFAASLANCIDKAFLYGQKDNTGAADSAAPTGIMNDADVLSITAGTSASYDDFVKAATAIRKNNCVPAVWAMNAETDGALSLLKDSNGNYMPVPEPLAGMKRIVTNQLASDAENGSDALVFDPAAMMIGIQENLIIKIIEDGECLKKGLVAFQIYSMQDCKVIRPKAICRISGIK